MLKLDAGNPEVLTQVPSILAAHRGQDLGGARTHPRGHHIRVRIIVKAFTGTLRVAVVVFIRAQTTAQMEPAVRVALRHGGEEPGNVQR